MDNMFNFSTVNDSFNSLANIYLAREQIKASNPRQSMDELNQLTSAPMDVIDRVNVEPYAPSTPNITGRNADITRNSNVGVAGVQLNKTALWIAGGALAAAFILKVL